MKIKKLIRPAPLCLFPRQDLHTAYKLMKEKDLVMAPVVVQEKFKGVLMLGSRSTAINLTVADVMVVDVPVVYVDDLDDDLLEFQAFPGVPVVDKAKHLHGIIWLGDMFAMLKQERQKQETWLQKIINSVHNGIVAIDNTGHITLCNAAAMRMFDLTDNIEGRFIFDIFEGSSLLEVLKQQRPNFGGKYQVGDKCIIGNRTPVKHNGKTIGAVSVFQDISEVEAISSRLENVRRINSELNAIIESSHDGIVITDNKGVIMRVNKAVEGMLDLAGDYFIGKSAQELERKGIINCSAISEVIATGKPVTVNQTTINGKEIITTATPVFDEHDNLNSVVANIKDVTELNELRFKLEKSQTSVAVNGQHSALKAQMQDCGIVAESEKMLKVIDTALKFAEVDATVFILGESGVGKELIAHLIYKNSVRYNRRFIRVNCGAIPGDLMESEFFGYEGGAFTGAKGEGKPGYFELANQGTLFLDEIAELPFELQVKLLRAIQEREIMRVGGTKPIKVDVRIIAATNRDMEEMVRQGSFREDLYYRLNVLPIVIPPLRSRPDDISALLTAFLDKFCQKHKTGKLVSGETLDILVQYSWPGNVRELENLVERLVITAEGEVILPDDLPERIINQVEQQPANGLTAVAKQGKEPIQPLKDAVEQVEKDLIIRAIQMYGSTYKAAKILGVSQSTIARKAKKYYRELERRSLEE